MRAMPPRQAPLLNGRAVCTVAVLGASIVVMRLGVALVLSMLCAAGVVAAENEREVARLQALANEVKDALTKGNLEAGSRLADELGRLIARHPWYGSCACCCASTSNSLANASAFA